MISTAPDPVLTLKDVAAELKKHRKTVERYIHKGELRAVRRGGCWFIRRSWLDDFLTPDDVD